MNPRDRRLGRVRNFGRRRRNRRSVRGSFGNPADRLPFRSRRRGFAFAARPRPSRRFRRLLGSFKRRLGFGRRSRGRRFRARTKGHLRFPYGFGRVEDARFLGRFGVFASRRGRFGNHRRRNPSGRIFRRRRSGPIERVLRGFRIHPGHSRAPHRLRRRESPARLFGGTFFRRKTLLPPLPRALRIRSGRVARFGESVGSVFRTSRRIRFRFRNSLPQSDFDYRIPVIFSGFPHFP